MRYRSFYTLKYGYIFIDRLTNQFNGISITAKVIVNIFYLTTSTSQNKHAYQSGSVASTALYEQGIDSLLIETCLSHTDQNAVRASYNRSDYLEQRKEIMT